LAFVSHFAFFKFIFRSSALPCLHIPLKDEGARLNKQLPCASDQHPVKVLPSVLPKRREKKTRKG